MKRTRRDNDVPSKKSKMDITLSEEKRSKNERDNNKYDSKEGKEKDKKQTKEKSSRRATKACEPAALKKKVSKLASDEGISLADLADHMEKSNEIKRSRIETALLSLRIALKDDRLVVIE